MFTIDSADKSTWPPTGKRVRFIVEIDCCEEHHEVFEEYGFFEPPGAACIDEVGCESKAGWGVFHGEQGHWSWDDVAGWSFLH